jgi:hypothetical protein
MKNKDSAIKVSAKAYKAILRLKEETNLPIKYIVEQAISLLDGEMLVWSKKK